MTDSHTHIHTEREIIGVSLCSVRVLCCEAVFVVLYKLNLTIEY